MRSRTEVPAINFFIMLAGVWLMITAFAFQYHFGSARFGYSIGSPPEVNGFFVGFFIFVIALLCVVNSSASSWLSWVTVAFGIWLILSPFLFGYANLGIARWNENIIGVIVVGLGVWSAVESRGRPFAHR